MDYRWKYFKERVLSAIEKKRLQTWWWDNFINYVIMKKRRLWKVWKNGGSKEDYAKAKKVAKYAYLLPKERPWTRNSVMKMTSCFVWLSR